MTTFAENQTVIHDLQMTGWSFMPEKVVIVAVNKNSTYDIKHENGRITKGVRSCVLRAE